MTTTTFYAAILLIGLHWSPPAPAIPPPPEPTPLELAFTPTTRTMTLEALDALYAYIVWKNLRIAKIF